MRLIDADKFKQEISGMVVINGYPAKKANACCELIDIQPTAYDVDYVINELKKCHGMVNSKSVDYAEGLRDAYERAIDIVRLSGNVNN